MASSGSFNTTGYTATDGTRYLVFEWQETSQSITANTTTISWTLKGAGTSSQYIYAGNFKVVIAGTTVYSVDNSNRIPLKNGTVVASGTFTFTHKDDGTQGFTASAQGSIYWHEVNYTGSGTFTLDTIARASQPSLVTWPETTNNVGDFGVEFSIHMNRKSSAFTHTVRYEYGSRKGTIATGVATGTTWAVPLSFMNDIPNATSASGRIYVDTYNGNTLVGTKYTGFTVTVPASVKPSCSLTLEDITGVDDIYGSPVQGLSKIKITVNTTLSYSSPIASSTITADGVSYTGLTATTEVLQKSGSSVVTATVKDTRGRSGSDSYTMNVQAYEGPRISSLTVHRCDSDGTENDQGLYIRVLFSAAIYSMGSKNTAAYKLRYKKSTASTWTEVAISALNNVYTVTDREYIFPADETSSYDVEVTATDRHSSATRATSASTAFSLMDWHPSGTGIAFGKVAQKENTMEISLDVEFLGQVKGAIFDAIYPVGTIYLAYNHTDPGTLFGGTWERIQNTFLWATTSGGTIGLTGGEQEVTLTVDQIPSHSHGSVYSQHAPGTKGQAWYTTAGTSLAYGAVATGGGQAHNNMPPYIQVSIWRRTA